jgi:hypothetical protein
MCLEENSRYDVSDAGGAKDLSIVNTLVMGFRQSLTFTSGSLDSMEARRPRALRLA